MWLSFCLMAAVVYSAAIFYNSYYKVEVLSKQVRYDHIQEMYLKLVAATGRYNDVPPLIIVDEPVVNAYASPDKIVLYQGIIDFSKNDDEIALILGHEIAHVLLSHLDKLSAKTTEEQQVLESMADKMGAYYMMRIGYDVCKGREIWKRFELSDGDKLGGSHPSDAYRYNQLNVQCE